MSKKGSLQQIIDHVYKHHPGGKVLSTEYIDCNQKIHFECEKGHIFFSRNIGVLRNNYWCKKCATLKMILSRSYSLEEVTEKIMQLHPGSQILDNVYKNEKTKINIVCENSHKISIRFESIINGHWCAECAGVKKVTLDKIIDFINKNYPGSAVLSKTVFNSKNKLEVVCEKGHLFNPISKTIFNGHWCPVCGKEKYKNTCMEKYGVDSPAKNKEIALKISKSSNNSTLKIHWKTKEELVCQGSWEAKTVDYLNNNKIEFDWQSKVFVMPNGRTYRPDLFLINENKWIEIKGYFRKDSKEKWDWFKEQFSTAELWNQQKLKEMGIL